MRTINLDRVAEITNVREGNGDIPVLSARIVELPFRCQSRAQRRASGARMLVTHTVAVSVEIQSTDYTLDIACGTGKEGKRNAKSVMALVVEESAHAL